MNQKNIRYLEKCILENTDRLIESAIAASLLGDEAKEQEFRRGTKLIGEIARNLKDLIDVKDEYLPEILNQIISQKLPDTKVQKSLGTFTMELDKMVQLGIIALGSNIEFTPNSEAYLESEFEGDSQGTEGSHTNKGSKEGNIEIIDPVPSVEITYNECEEPLTGPCLIEDVEFVPIPELIPVEEFLAVEAMSPLVVIDGSVKPNESEKSHQLTEPNELNELLARSTVTLTMEEEPLTPTDLANPTLEELAEQEEEIVDGILIGDLLNRTVDYGLQAKTASEVSMVEPQTPILINLLNGFENSDPEPVAVFQPKGKGYQSRNLEFSLRLIFPGVEILRDVTLDGISFGYYIPSKWLAFDQEISPEDWELKAKICQQEGIMYLIIDHEDGKNPRRVERIIQRHKINTRG